MYRKTGCTRMKVTEVAKLDHPASIGAFDTIQRSARPFLFPEVVSTWPARERWNIDYFESAEGSTSIPIGLFPNGNYFEPSVVVNSTMRDYCEWLRNPPRREKYYLTEVEINRSLPKL